VQQGGDDAAMHHAAIGVQVALVIGQEQGRLAGLQLGLRADVARPAAVPISLERLAQPGGVGLHTLIHEGNSNREENPIITEVWSGGSTARGVADQACGLRARYSSLCISRRRLAVRWNSKASLSPRYSAVGGAAAERISLMLRS